MVRGFATYYGIVSLVSVTPADEVLNMYPLTPSVVAHFPVTFV